MGLVNTKVILTNPRDDSIQPLELDALADTGSVHLVIPQYVQYQLGLDVLEHREVMLADGSVHSVPYVGPIQLRFKNRTGFATSIAMLGKNSGTGATSLIP